MTIQLIGKDDTSFDDSEVLTGRWQSYIDSFVTVRSILLGIIKLQLNHLHLYQSETTETVPTTKMRLPFLRK
jgi:paired amphipathic helix protein Sin3a